MEGDAAHGELCRTSETRLFLTTSLNPLGRTDSVCIEFCPKNDSLDLRDLSVVCDVLVPGMAPAGRRVGGVLT